MKKSILYILFALFSLSAAVSLTACKDDGVEISGANKSKTPKNVKLLEYGPTSLTICWDFIRGATSYTVQLVDGEMNPVSEALCKTTDAIDYHEFTDLATDRIYYGRVRAILDVEMSIPAQMVRDVELAVSRRCPIETCLHAGGEIMGRNEVMARARALVR